MIIAQPAPRQPHEVTPRRRRSSGGMRAALLEPGTRAQALEMVDVGHRLDVALDRMIEREGLTRC